MRPVDQTIFTVPGGNCFSACVASILHFDLNDVPYFMGESDWFAAFRAWLKPHHYGALQVFGMHAEVTESGILWIAGGRSPRGDYLHAVVMKGSVMVHDPHPSRAGIVGDVVDTTLIFSTVLPALHPRVNVRPRPELIIDEDE